jgi:hypothetical protein
MNQPNLFDLAAGLMILASILGACGRGAGKEMLHTLFFTAAVVGGYFYMRGNIATSTAAEVAGTFVNIGYYLATSYVFTWAVMKFAAPFMLDGMPPGIRSRFWGGILAMVKLLVAILGANLWLAVHSPDTHPTRLQALPALLHNSTLVQLSDSVTEELYIYLAQRNILLSHQYTSSPATKTEDNLDQTKEFLDTELNQP